MGASSAVLPVMMTYSQLQENDPALNGRALRPMTQGILLCLGDAVIWPGGLRVITVDIDQKQYISMYTRGRAILRKARKL